MGSSVMPCVGEPMPALASPSGSVKKRGEGLVNIFLPSFQIAILIGERHDRSSFRYVPSLLLLGKNEVISVLECLFI